MCGCNHQPVNPAAVAQSASRIQEAIVFVKKHYHVSVKRIDDKTIGVMWESGAEAEFAKLRDQIKKDYNVETRITAIE